MKNLLTFLVLALVLISCQEPAPVVPLQKVLSIGGRTQGTTYQIKYVDSLNRNIKPAVDSILEVIDRSVSTYNSNSIIARFNDADSCMLINEHVLDLFLMSDEIFETSQGAFDPTIKPLVNLWGFGDSPFKSDTLFSAVEDPRKRADLIQHFMDSMAEETLESTGWEMVILDGDILYNNINDLGNKDFKDNYICKEDSGVALSFDAIAQGFSVDLIADHLQYKLGLSDFLIDVGGEMIAQGKKPNGESWKIRIQNPDLSDAANPGAAVVNMKDFRALAVSGDYRNYRELNGKRYGHCIDPRTGKPAKSQIVSSAVFSNDCAIADAYATAFMVMGIEEAVPFVEGNPYERLEAFFIYYNEEGDLETYVSSGLEEFISQ